MKWSILTKLIYDNKESVYKWERFLIESFDTIKNEMNECLPYTTPEEKKERQKVWRDQNAKQLAQNKKEYAQKKKEQIFIKRRQYRLNNKEQITEKKKQYYEENKEKIKEKNKLRYEQQKNEINEKRRQYYEEHRDEMNEKQKEKISCSICNKMLSRSSMTEHKRTQH